MLFHLFQLCIFIVFNYICVFHLLKNTNKNFKKLKFEKQLYVVKNIIKSYFLAFISITGSTQFIHFFKDGIFNNNFIRQYANTYVANDLMALLIVPNLPESTFYHHMCTIFLLLYCYSVDFNDLNSPGRLMIILTIFSSYSFLVNFYLGARFITEKKDKSLLGVIVKKSKNIAFIWYIICCIINWTLQSIILILVIYKGFFNIRYSAYMFILGFIIKDDLILMKWLKD